MLDAQLSGLGTDGSVLANAQPRCPLRPPSPAPQPVSPRSCCRQAALLRRSPNCPSPFSGGAASEKLSGDKGFVTRIPVKRAAMEAYLLRPGVREERGSRATQTLPWVTDHSKPSHGHASPALRSVFYFTPPPPSLSQRQGLCFFPAQYLCFKRRFYYLGCSGISLFFSLTVGMTAS